MTLVTLTNDRHVSRSFLRSRMYIHMIYQKTVFFFSMNVPRWHGHWTLQSSCMDSSTSLDKNARLRPYAARHVVQRQPYVAVWSLRTFGLCAGISISSLKRILRLTEIVCKQYVSYSTQKCLKCRPFITTENLSSLMSDHTEIWLSRQKCPLQIFISIS